MRGISLDSAATGDRFTQSRLPGLIISAISKMKRQLFSKWSEI